MRHAIRLSIGLMVVIMTTVVLLWFSGCTPINEQGGDEYGRRGVNDTYSYLEPYGAWITHPRFGEVWRPDVGSDWAPFSEGDWVYTNEGWLWSSYEPYGWLVYHYGNWYHDMDNGWFWVPGDTWSPACVTWVAYGDYVGWAPTPPPGGVWPTPWDNQPVTVWNVVEVHNFTQENVGFYRVKVQAPNTGQHTTVAHKPPDLKSIERFLKRNVAQVKVTREAESIGKKTYYKPVLPADEEKRVEQHKSKFVKQAKPAATKAPEQKPQPQSNDNKQGGELKERKVRPADRDSTDRGKDNPNDRGKDRGGDDNRPPDQH